MELIFHSGLSTSQEVLISQAEVLEWMPQDPLEKNDRKIEIESQGESKDGFYPIRFILDLNSILLKASKLPHNSSPELLLVSLARN